MVHELWHRKTSYWQNYGSLPPEESCLSTSVLRYSTVHTLNVDIRNNR